MIKPLETVLTNHHYIVSQQYIHKSYIRYVTYFRRTYKKNIISCDRVYFVIHRKNHASINSLRIEGEYIGILIEKEGESLI